MSSITLAICFPVILFPPVWRYVCPNQLNASWTGTIYPPAIPAYAGSWLAKNIPKITGIVFSKTVQFGPYRLAFTINYDCPNNTINAGLTWYNGLVFLCSVTTHVPRVPVERPLFWTCDQYQFRIPPDVPYPAGRLTVWT